MTGNLTVTEQTSFGYLYVGPVAVDYPTSSTLNFPTADNRANGVTVALGSGGTLSVTYVAPTLGPTSGEPMAAAPARAKRRRTRRRTES